MRSGHSLFLLGSALLALSSSGAQSTGQRIGGVVFDSVARAPLAGATVQIAAASPNGRAFGAVTDSAGRFHVDGVPPGDYVVGFDHLSLQALGLETPLRSVRVDATGPVEVNLAIPSPETVRGNRCGTRVQGASDGMIAGFVRDADRELALVGATVDVRWNEIVVVPGRATLERRRAFTVVRENGTYFVCGIPSDARLTVKVTASGHVDGSVELELPPGGAARQDVLVADSSAVTVITDASGTPRLRGSATLTGRARLRDGKPAAGARIVLEALGLEAKTDAKGAFSFTRLPPGRWMVEARSIGWEPAIRQVSLQSARASSIVLSFDTTLAILGTVLVKGEKSRVTLLMERLLQRRLAGGGTIFIAGDAPLEAAHNVTDVLRSARGFTIKKEEDGNGVTITGRGSGSVTNETGECTIRVYLNGEPMSPDFKEIDYLVQPREVLAIEAYNSFDNVPIEYRNQYTCGAIIIWTKR